MKTLLVKAKKALYCSSNIILLQLFFCSALVFIAISTGAWWTGGGLPEDGYKCRMSLTPKKAKLAILIDCCFDGTKPSTFDVPWAGIEFSISPIIGPHVRARHCELFIAVPPIILGIGLAAAPLFFFLRRFAIPILRSISGRCYSCGYITKFNVSAFCSECGAIPFNVFSVASFCRWILFIILAGVILWLSSCFLLWTCASRLTDFDKVDITGNCPAIIDNEIGYHIERQCALSEFPVPGKPGPASTIHFSNTMRYLRQAATQFECDNRFPAIFAGRCNNGSIQFIKYSFGSGWTSLYFDANDESAIGATVLSDVRDTDCKGRRYWHIDLVCREFIVEEVVCGTITRVGATGSTVLPE